MMSDRLEIVLQALLHPTEVVKVALETTTLPRPDVETEHDNKVVIDLGIYGVQRRILLAVITHRDTFSSSTGEQGCVFLFSVDSVTATLSDANASKTHFIFRHAYPITKDFSITMSQQRRDTLDLRPSAIDSSATQHRTELLLTLTHGPSAKPLYLVTQDIQGLKTVLEECKRIKEVSDGSLDNNIPVYPWVAPYVATSIRPAILSPIPPDLRILKKPVHILLSPASAGFPGDENSDIAIIRANWIRSKVQEELISNCSETSSLRIRIGTFNVNGKMPSQDLSTWVRGHRNNFQEKLIPPLEDISPLSLGEMPRNPLDEKLETTGVSTNSTSPIASMTSASDTAALDDTLSEDNVIEDKDDPDMLVLAFQELDLSTEALLYSTKTTREEAWCMAAFAALGEKAVLYEKLVSKQLVGMLLVVIVKKRLNTCFRDIKTASVGAGIMGIMGNKGATALRIAYVPTMPSTPVDSDSNKRRPTIFTFVNSHLAAFDEMYERRNADFHDLSKRLSFDADMSVPAPAGQGSNKTPAAIPINVFETDVLFWMGDLNYRINLPDADIRDLLSCPLPDRENEIRTLFDYDQLSLAIRTKKAFEDFREARITHPPSYRFSAGIATDPQGYDIKRKPAWTDRILHLSSDAMSLRQLTYSSHPEITMSDHRPVSGDFEIHIPLLVSTSFEHFIQGLWRDVASIEYSNSMPEVKLSDTVINFGNISYKRLVSRDLILENIGKTPCIYRFVRAEHETALHPAWLRIDRLAGLLLPGQRTNIVVSSFVDNASAANLNVGPSHLEHTLILHTALGKDHFISITGDYERTCFANDLTWLARLPGPIRALRNLDQLLPADHAMSAPREVMRLIKWIMTHATDVEGLFIISGEDELKQGIRDCLDTGAEFKSLNPIEHKAAALAFADTLLEFLEVLPNPVFPFALHAKCVQVSTKEEAFELLDELPSVSLNVWISVTALLHYITQQPASKPNIDRLVAVFASTLLRGDDSLTVPTSLMARRRFLRYFIM